MNVHYLLLAKSGCFQPERFRYRFEVIVIGLGGHGSAALYHLAQRGVKVLGIEQYSVAHDKGSSHGESRIIRLAYHEHPDYVPLLQRAWTLWLELQKRSGKFLLCDTGCIEACHPNLHGGHNVFTKALHSAHEHDLEHEVLSGTEVNQRFPGYQLPPEFKAVLAPGGILASERCIAAHIDLAKQSGAHVRLGERVLTWHANEDSVLVTTDKRRYSAKKLILAAGAWMPQLVPELQAVLKVERQVIGWFEILKEGCFRKETFPVGIADGPVGEFYWFPEFELPGMKIGKFYHLKEKAEEPSKLRRTITAADEQALREGVQEWLPLANGRMLHASACMFTNSTDHHFIVDRHPNHERVIICSPCSGHGFKFCSVLGEIMADLSLTGSSVHDADILKIKPTRPGFEELLRRFGESNDRRSRL